MWRSKQKQVLKPFYREKQRKFTGMYRKVSWDMAFSSLDSVGNPRKCQWAYRESSRFTGILRWAPRYFTGEWPVNFQFPGKSLYLFLLGTSHILTKIYLANLDDTICPRISCDRYVFFWLRDMYKFLYFDWVINCAGKLFCLLVCLHAHNRFRWEDGIICTQKSTINMVSTSIWYEGVWWF